MTRLINIISVIVFSTQSVWWYMQVRNLLKADADVITLEAIMAAPLGL